MPHTVAIMKLSLLFGMLTAGALAACTAFSDAEVSDKGTQGDDQNLEEMPCKPIAELRCAAGYHTISTLNCDDEMGRCIADGCAPESTFECTKGYVKSNKFCSGARASRCTKPDGGAGDGGSDASKDAASRD